MRSNCKSRVIRRGINICSRDKNILDSPDCLPDGWTVELKYRKSGPKVGEKYKCYVAPITGCKFYSKKDVARYLNTEMLSNGPPILTTRPADANSEDNRKDLVNGLPPGWIKEVKVRKTGDRRDPYYSHPGCEYVFRSKKDVFRFVELGKVGRLAMKRKKQDFDNVKVEECTSPPSAAKRQKLRVRARGRRLFTEGSGVGDCKNAQISEPVVPKGDTPPSHDASDMGGDCADLSGLILPENKDSEERQMKTDCAENKAIILATPQDNEVEKCTERKTQHRKRINKKDLNVPRRSSERLAALRAVHSPKLGTSDQVRQQVAVQSVSLKADLTISSVQGGQAHQSKELSQLESEPEGNLMSQVSKVINDREENHDCRYSLEMEEQSGMYGMGHCPREELSNEFGKLDGIQVSSGRLEVGEKADGKPEYPLVSPFGDSWPDPCLEFAFKTLTGAIPVEENLIIEDYLKLQLNSDCNQNTREFPQPGFVADGVCGTDLFKFDARVKPSDLPEMKWNPGFSTSGNESKRNYDKNVLQWDGERKK